MDAICLSAVSPLHRPTNICSPATGSDLFHRFGSAILTTIHVGATSMATAATAFSCRGPVVISAGCHRTGHRCAGFGAVHSILGALQKFETGPDGVRPVYDEFRFI